jgi:hypothetical protein
MATLNQILAISESVGINDQKFVGQVISRNQRISTSEIVTVQPFAFEMKPMNYLLYTQNRSLLSTLRVADREYEQYLNFGSTGWWNYIVYQGDLTALEVQTAQWETSSANKTLVLGNLPVGMPATDYIVKTGDFCQVGRYAYIATADVQRGTGSTVNIPVHRNLITPLSAPVNAVLGQYGITVSMGGNTYIGVTFPIILVAYPNYTLVPITNDSFIQWSGTFKAFEAVLP